VVMLDYALDAGPVVRVEVSEAVAEALSRPDPRPKEVAFTDLLGRRRGGDEDRQERLGRFLSAALNSYYLRGTRLAPAGNPWEGPRFQFTLLVGLSAIWRGPAAGPCPFHGAALPPEGYCVACDASGRDALIPRPTAAELRARAEKVPRPGGLAGGRGKAAVAKARRKAKARRRG
jgi:hypothetical protein